MSISRRALLRGAGVCLALPYLESFAPRARAAATPPRRYVVCYFPNGTAEAYWPPTGVGSGSAWALSPILAPLAAFKSQMSVYSNMENHSSIQDVSDVEPSHSRLTGAYLTCSDSDMISKTLNVTPANGVSVDQLIAAKMTTGLPSLEVGLSTVNSDPDGRHPALSRSIAWKTQTQPLYKEINPQAVFDRLVGSGNYSGMSDPNAVKLAMQRKALKLSVLDFTMESATTLGAKLGREDKPRLDQYLSSVRELENRVRALDGTLDPEAASCKLIARPTQVYAVNKTDGYNRGTHSSIMNQLIVMALQCDMTRVITHMMDDSRSEFVYDHVTMRKFTTTGSTLSTGQVGNFHGLQHAGNSNDGFATINWWLSTQVADLCQKMAAVDEGDGTLLDHTLLQYSGEMHGGNHDSSQLPVVLLGGSKQGIRGDQHVNFSSLRPVRDMYYTILNSYFNLGAKSFGTSLHGAPNQTIAEMLL